MFDFLLTREQKALREEVRDLVRWVPRQMILDMDEEQDPLPQGVSARGRQARPARGPLPERGAAAGWTGWHLHGHRGGRHARLHLRLRVRRGRGAGLRRHRLHGTDAQHEQYVKPLLGGEIFAAECLTEPRGGSDFFGTTTRRAARRPLPAQRPEALHRRRRGGRLLPGLRAHRPRRPSRSRRSAASSSIAAPGVETEYLYGLMGCRGGGAAGSSSRTCGCPQANLLGTVHGGAAVFNTMMIPERLGTAAMTIGAARPALRDRHALHRSSARPSARPSTTSRG